MNCQIISIGDELLTGQVINTNAATLAQILHGVGVRTEAVHTIPDTTDVMVSCLKNVWDVADLIIMTGGIGPTKDDVTKKALAAFFNVGMEFSEITFKRLQKLFKRLGKDITEAHKAQ
jgi:nicotinamide-nucleotide amidase